MKQGIRRNVSRGLAMLVAAVALATPAAADLNHYVQITGATQGAFPGSANTVGFENHLVGFELHHLMERPAGGSSVEHQTLICTVDLGDRALPHLLRALESNEALTVVFKLRRPETSGAEVTYAEITLSGGRLVSVEPLSPNGLDPASSAIPLATARLRFAYGSLGFRHVPTNDTVQLVNAGS
jgi:type VI secretion system Hcp family effector